MCTAPDGALKASPPPRSFWRKSRRTSSSNSNSKRRSPTKSSSQNPLRNLNCHLHSRRRTRRLPTFRTLSSTRHHRANWCFSRCFRAKCFKTKCRCYPTSILISKCLPPSSRPEWISTTTMIMMRAACKQERLTQTSSRIRRWRSPRMWRPAERSAKARLSSWRPATRTTTSIATSWRQ